jgi:hypothetical protein
MPESRSNVRARARTAIETSGLLLAVFMRFDAARTANAYLRARHERAQLWRGGRLDRATRMRLPYPAYWLVCADMPVPRLAAVEVTDATLGWRLEQLVPGDETSPDGAGAVAITATDIAPEIEDEFNAWYSTEHLPRLAAIRGVMCARRFRAIDGSSRYVAVYHLESAETHRCPEWQSANATPWTQRLRPLFLRPQSFVFDTLMAADE